MAKFEQCFQITALLVLLLLVSSIYPLLKIKHRSTNMPLCANTTNQAQKIPKIIHQQYKTKDSIPERWNVTHSSVLRLHPDWQVILWTDEELREFIATEYTWFLPTYDNYPYWIQRVDAVRYFLIYHFGGIYMDLDIGCTKSMDPLLYYDAVLARTEPFGFSNDFMAATKHHPLFKHYTQSLNGIHSYLFLFSTSPTVLFSTGPMFVSLQYYLRYDLEEPVCALPRELYGSEMLFHVEGMSWRTYDTDTMAALWQQFWLIKILVFFASLGLAICVSTQLISMFRKCWNKFKLKQAKRS